MTNTTALETNPMQTAIDTAVRTRIFPSLNIDADAPSDTLMAWRAMQTEILVAFIQRSAPHMHRGSLGDQANSAARIASAAEQLATFKHRTTDNATAWERLNSDEAIEFATECVRIGHTITNAWWKGSMASYSTHIRKLTDSTPFLALVELHFEFRATSPHPSPSWRKR